MIKSFLTQIKEYWITTQGLLNNLWRIFLIGWNERRGLTLLIFCLGVAGAFLSFLSSAALALLVNTLSAHAGVFSSLIGGYVILYIAATYLPDIASNIRIYAEKRSWIGMGESLQLKVLRKLSSLDIQTHDDPKFQDLANKLKERDVWPALNTFERMSDGLQSISIILIAVVILFTVKPWVSIVVILSIIPQFFAELRYGEDSWSIWDADIPTRRRFSDLRHHFSNRSWLVELKLFQNIQYFYQRMKQMLVDFNNKQRKVEKGRLILQLVSSIVSAALMTIVIVWIARQAVLGLITVGGFVFALGAISRLQSSLQRFFSYLAQQYERNKYVTNMFDFFDVPLALPRSSNPIRLMNPTPRIVFENVSFIYPHGDEKKKKGTLQNISVTIEPGEKFALVGENGAGKTTFVRLLCRIYDPTEGRILIDGHDLREIDLESWYAILGVLFQDFAPYYFQVKNAIALGRSDIELDLERVKESAQGSESETFINEWKDGYDQMLGTEFEGIDPSKGQSQRLAVARLLYRKAGVLILDEPTASIDAEAEMRIFNRIESLSRNQTVFLISHKYSTVKRADRICVINHGKILELGSHADLMKLNGTYTRLFREQAEAYST